jgi:hypothetical protein
MDASYLKFLAFTFSIALLMPLGIIYLFIQPALQPRIVTVDLQELIRADVAAKDLEKLEEKQIEQYVSKIIDQRKAQIEKYAVKNKFLVLPKSLVLSKGTDITATLQKLDVSQ